MWSAKGFKEGKEFRTGFTSSHKEKEEKRRQ